MLCPVLQARRAWRHLMPFEPITSQLASPSTAVRAAPAVAKHWAHCALGFYHRRATLQASAATLAQLGPVGPQQNETSLLLVPLPL
jgi:hypothetical protein